MRAVLARSGDFTAEEITVMPDNVVMREMRRKMRELGHRAHQEIEVAEAAEAAKPVAERAAAAKRHLLLNVGVYGVDEERLTTLDDEDVLAYYDKLRDDHDNKVATRFYPK